MNVYLDVKDLEIKWHTLKLQVQNLEMQLKVAQANPLQLICQYNGIASEHTEGSGRSLSSKAATVEKVCIRETSGVGVK
jgi:hypothetical protein